MVTISALDIISYAPLNIPYEPLTHDLINALRYLCALKHTI
jgi:hypothetical protein